MENMVAMPGASTIGAGLMVLIMQTVRSAGEKLLWFFSKKPVKLMSRILLTLLFVMLVNKGVSGMQLRRLAGDINPAVCGAAFLFGAVSLYMQVVRWRLLLQFHHFASGTITAARTMFKGFLLAFVTPGRVGELLRAVDLDASRKKESVFAVFEERFFGIAAIVTTGIAAIVLELLIFNHPPFIPLLLASLLFVALLFVLYFYCKGLQRLPSFLHRFPRLQGWLQEHHVQFVDYPATALLLLSAGAQLCLLFETALLMSMFGAGSIGSTMIVAAKAYSFMLLLPFFIANIGLREYSFSFFLLRITENEQLISSSSAIALGTATCILVFNIMIPAAIGLIWFIVERRSS